MARIVGRLLALAVPLLAAANIRKRKAGKKSARPKIRAKITRSRSTQRAKKTQRAVRPVARRRNAQPKRPARRAHPAAAKKALRGAVAVGARAEAAEPLPKPAPPTGRAILLSPENEKFADSVHPRFRWLSVGGATRYEVTWSEDPRMTTSHSIVSVATEAAVPVEKPLRVSVTYHWRVRGGNEGGWGPWSSVGSFRVLEETEQET